MEPEAQWTWIKWTGRRPPKARRLRVPWVYHESRQIKQSVRIVGRKVTQLIRTAWQRGSGVPSHRRNTEFILCPHEEGACPAAWHLEALDRSSHRIACARRARSRKQGWVLMSLHPAT